ASPWPTSHAATVHAPGVAARSTSPVTGPAARAAPAEPASTSTPRRRTRAGPGTTTARTAAPSRVSNTSPGSPSGHGTAATGSCARVVAVAAIQAAGSQAMTARPTPSPGTAADRQASRPTTVPTGAAGAASMFATTP